MPKLVWDQEGKRQYETGTSKGALFLASPEGGYEPGVAWNGLVAVRQTPDGAEPTDIFADNIKYLSLISAENFKATVEAYTYPDEFAACEGSKEMIPGVTVGQQARRGFGMVYSTLVGNDTLGTDYGQKIHIIYGAKVAPTERGYETVNNDPNAITFSWSVSTTPEQIDIPGVRPSAYICVDSTRVTPEVFTQVSDLVYGSAEKAAELPSAQALLTLLMASAPAGASAANVIEETPEASE